MGIQSYLLKNQFIAALLIVAVGMFLLQIKDILLLIFFSSIITSTLAPAVRFLQKYKIPKVLCITILYVVIIAFLSLLITPLVPFFVDQFQSLLQNFPSFIDQAVKTLHLRINTEQINSIISSQLATVGQNAVALTSGIFGSFFSIVTVIVISFYLLLDHDNIIGKIPTFFPSHHQKVKEGLREIEETLGDWFRGQMLLSLSVGLFTWLALSLIGLTYALPLAVLAGMLEIIPTIGPIVSSIPAIIVGFSVSPTTALTVALAFLLVQQLENNILVPKIMERAVGLHPVVIILGVIMGGQFAGVLGALLSAPLLSVLYIFLKKSQK